MTAHLMRAEEDAARPKEELDLDLDTVER